MKNKQPDIRFSEYKDSWVTTKLKDIASFSKGSGYKKSDIKLSGTPIILYGSLYTNYQTVIEDIRTYADKKEKTVLSDGDEVIVPSSGESSEDISRASVIKNSGVIIGGDLNIIRTNKKIDPVFLALTISNGNQKKELVRRAQGKSVVHLNNSDLSQVKLTHPNIQEQQKIGEFFKQLDDRIALQQRRVEQLKQSKQGFLQKMFPKDSVSLPKVRFDGFSEDWGNYKIKQIVNPVFREVPKPNKSYTRLSVRSHAKGTFHQRVEDPQTIAMTKLYVVRENDLIVNITFAWEHAIAVATKDDDGLYVSHRFPTYRTNEKMDINFLRYLVTQKEFKHKLDLISPGGAGRNRVLNKNDFLDLNVIIPNEVKEQQKIGEFFKQLDDLITKNERELELLQETKKGFLQKMFV